MAHTSADFNELTPGRAARGSARGANRSCGTDGGALWTIQEASRYLNLSVSAVYKMTAQKRRSISIPHIRIGGKLRFRQRDLDRWLELLTVSNLEVLAKVRSRKVSNGNDSQAETS